MLHRDRKSLPLSLSSHSSVLLAFSIPAFSFQRSISAPFCIAFGQSTQSMIDVRTPCEGMYDRSVCRLARLSSEYVPQPNSSLSPKTQCDSTGLSKIRLQESSAIATLMSGPSGSIFHSYSHFHFRGYSFLLVRLTCGDQARRGCFPKLCRPQSGLWRFD